VTAIEGEASERNGQAVEILQAVGSCVNAFADRFEDLERQLKIVKEEAAVERKLVKLHKQVDSAIAKQPDQERELKETIGYLNAARVKVGALESEVEQLNKLRVDSTVKFSRTSIEVESIGAATREAMAQIEGIADWLNIAPAGNG
jgi:vacuolar-type H+-ATPase subunit I/STV1